MSMVSEDLLDLDWKDYEGIIGHDPMTHKYQVQLNHHLHWFDTRDCIGLIRERKLKIT